MGKRKKKKVYKSYMLNDIILAPYKDGGGYCRMEFYTVFGAKDAFKKAKNNTVKALDGIHLDIDTSYFFIQERDGGYKFIDPEEK